MQPTIFDNIAIKFSAIDYATLSYDKSFAKDDIFFLVENKDGKVRYSYQNVPDLSVYTISLGLPLPIILFTKGLNELMKFLQDNITVSVFGNDIFNTNRTVARTLPLNFSLSTIQKLDTRSFGISLIFRIKNLVNSQKYNEKIFEYKEKNTNQSIIEK